MPGPTFVFRSRYALLTYAQCEGLDHWSVLEHLSAIPAECIIGREAHADGGTHLHAFCDFGERFYTGNPRRFDVEGYHPNIQPFGRTPEKGWDYACKEGDVVCGGLGRPDGGRGAGADVSGASTQWDRIVGAETVEEFWRLVRELAPRTLLTNFNSVRAYADWHYRPVVAPYQNPTGIEFDLSGVEELREWVQDSLSRSG